ncbi:hypothetical protein DHEL01_v205889 [Diaporthe helianthi]|uniref:Uncharacterized protein n=1 Tax=Diaporthe helianthi TaxID=158607 RepID=A0A2P5HZP0_DIAHE|nr:hypothetical protein DHEL01_v205889 [Diaporthe helianthi]
MRRLRVRDPLGLCWACGGSISYNATSQKRTLIERSRVVGTRRKVKVKSHLPAFDLPDVVLDLDAEDSPYARPFNEKDAAQQRAKWGQNPLLPEVEERVAQLEKDIIRDRNKMNHILAARYHPYKISDLDVLSVALLGGNATASSLADHKDGAVDQDGPRQDDALLRGRNQALDNNGIPQRIQARDANTIIHFLLHRQRQAPVSHKTASASVNVNSSDTFENAVKHCKNLSFLKRLCLHSFSSGHEAITPASMDCIAGWFTDSKRNKPSRSYDQDALKLVNNLTMRQLSGNTGLSPSLSRVGLSLAANLALLPAIIQYLHICLSQGFIGGSTEDKPATLGAVGEGILQALKQGDGSARGTRLELFTLLTGRSLAGSTVQPSLFGSSLSSTEGDPDTHEIYVQLLGQLGAYRLLWHSWNKGTETRMRRYIPVYHAALIRCAEVLRDANNVAGLDCTTATGDLERDAELDMHAIDALDAYHASSTPAEDPYAFRIENAPSMDEITEVFMSTNIHQAVALVNDLITSAGTASTLE